MASNGWLQIAFFILGVLVVTKLLGLYLVAVYEGRVRWLAPVERALYRAAGLLLTESGVGYRFKAD